MKREEDPAVLFAELNQIVSIVQSLEVSKTEPKICKQMLGVLSPD